MQPLSSSFSNNQQNIFKASFEDLLYQKHTLFKLSQQVNWSIFETTMGGFFVESQGRPAFPVRLMVGIHYLKSIYNVSNVNLASTFDLRV